jgi:glutamyl-tRNA synthetase
MEARDIGYGKIMAPLRLAVSGLGYGPHLTPMLELLGKEATMRRIQAAVEKLG